MLLKLITLKNLVIGMLVGETWAKQLNAQFIKTSGKTGENVEHLMEILCNHPSLQVQKKDFYVEPKPSCLHRHSTDMCKIM